MGTNYYLVENRPTVHSPLHIGKSSIGWRFLFHEVSDWECDRSITSFKEWQDYIKETTEKGSHVLMDEYDDIVDVKEFFELVEAKQSNDNPDNFREGVKNIDGYRFDNSDFC